MKALIIVKNSKLNERKCIENIKKYKDLFDLYKESILKEKVKLPNNKEKDRLQSIMKDCKRYLL